VGINFVDLNEANKFSGLVNGTQSQRQIRARQQSANATIKTPIVNDKKRKEILKKKHLVISKPVENSFEHIMKVSQDKVREKSKVKRFYLFRFCFLFVRVSSMINRNSNCSKMFCKI